MIWRERESRQNEIQRGFEGWERGGGEEKGDRGGGEGYLGHAFSLVENIVIRGKVNLFVCQLSHFFNCCFSFSQFDIADFTHI